MDLELLSRDIKNKALEIGFSKIGITEAAFYKQDQDNLEKWLSNGFNGSMHWIERRKVERANIHKYYSNARSVISVALNYFTGVVTEDFNQPFVSNYALGKD